MNGYVSEGTRTFFRILMNARGGFLAAISVLFVLASSLGVGSAPAAAQTVLTFDDVPGNNLADGYGHFGGWAGLGLQDDTGYMTGGANTYGSPSGEHALGAGPGLSLTRQYIESPPGSCCIRESFDFIGAWFSAYTLSDQLYQNSAVAVLVEGYREGVLVASIDLRLSAGYIWLQADFINIDELRLQPRNGGFGTSARFLMDDLTFVAPSSGPVNAAPTARAGDNQTVRSGTAVHLDGSGSFDDNTPTNQLQYSWSLVSVPASSAVALIGANTIAPSFVPDLPGSYLVQLIVTDQGGLSSAPSQVSISDNPPPTANAGPDQLVILASVVVLSGSGADPDGDALTYAWALSGAPKGSTASLYTPTLATTTFIPDRPGVYTAQLTVRDLFGPGVPDSVQITATTAAGYAEVQIQAASTQVLGLPASSVSNSGNQNALTQFLSNAVVALQRGNSTAARHQLEQAISRTDGCALRGTPDGNGPSRDWITTCGDQSPIYQSLVAALAVIAP